MSPTQFRAAGGEAIGRPLHPGAVTCRPTKGDPWAIDFWVTPEQTRHRLRQTCVWRDTPIYTHDAVYLEAGLNPRPEVPGLWMPRRLPEPVQGPETWEMQRPEWSTR